MSEPPAKIIRLGDVSEGPLGENNNAPEFIVRICMDALLEVLGYGDRRRLIKLERIGRRYHRLIENFFKEAPFILICPTFEAFRVTLKFVIGSEVLTLRNLAEFPFVRCDAINLDYSVGSHLIANKCEVFVSQLQKVPRLNEANSISVSANISQKRRGDFRDRTQLLEHLRNKLLPICGYCRWFEFRIGLGSNIDAFTNIIASILLMQQVNECSDVVIRLVKPIIPIPIQYDCPLPVETIANWLHRNPNTDNGGKELTNQNYQRRVLEIETIFNAISNVLEMFHHLKTEFESAKTRLQPFTLRLKHRDVYSDRKEIFTNEKTNEVLSIEYRTFEMVEVKRTSKVDTIEVYSNSFL